MKVDLDTGIRDPRTNVAAEVAPQIMAAPEEMDLRRLFATVWRSRLMILIAALIGLGLAELHLRNVTPLYTATAEVMWEASEKNIIDIQPVEQQFRGDMLMRESQAEIIKSSRVLGKVADEIRSPANTRNREVINTGGGWLDYLSVGAIVRQVKRMFPFLVDLDEEAGAEGERFRPPEDERKRLVGRLRSMIDVNWAGNSYILRISATTAASDTSAQLANRVAHYYTLDQLERKYDATRQATEWLSERVAELREEVEAAEEAVEDFSADSDLVSPEALEVDGRRLKELRGRATEIDQRMGSIEDELATLARAREAGSLAAALEVLREDGLDGLARSLGQEVASVSAPSDVSRAWFDRQLASEDEERRDTLARLGQQHGALLESVANLEQRVDRNSDTLVRLRQLERDAEASRLLYESFLSRLKETTLQMGVQEADARLLTAAEPPGGSSWPNAPATYAVGATAGLFLGILIAVVRERLNLTFRTPEDLEARTGHSVLASLPVGPFGKRGELLDDLLARPTSGFAESLRNLRTSIQLSNLDHVPQVIVVNSGLPGEGKTTTCVALAQIARSLGKKVLLLECDLRRSTMHEYFGVEPGEGLFSVLTGTRPFSEAVYVDERTGLHVLFGEESTINAADVFASNRFGDFVAKVRSHYDLILIDTPPVLAVPDARPISRHADGVLYLVRWNRTMRDTVAQGLRVFQQTNTRVLGLVLAQIDVTEMARYGYRAYYHYRRETAHYYQT